MSFHSSSPTSQRESCGQLFNVNFYLSLHGGIYPYSTPSFLKLVFGMIQEMRLPGHMTTLCPPLRLGSFVDVWDRIIIRFDCFQKANTDRSLDILDWKKKDNWWQHTSVGNMFWPTNETEVYISVDGKLRCDKQMEINEHSPVLPL